MTERRGEVVRMYEGALRALDTKAQIFLGFMTLSLAPVFTRLATLGAVWPVRAGLASLFAAAALAFVICLFPRRGTRSSQVFFDIAKTPEEVRALASREDFDIDYADTIATLHGIYAIKARSLRAGIVLLAAYVVASAAALAAA